MHIREVLYRLTLAKERRAPALALRGLEDRRGVSVETLVANLDEGGNVWRIVAVAGPSEKLERIEARFLESQDVSDRRVLEKSRLRLVLWYKYPPVHPGRGPSLTRLAFDGLGREVAITDWTDGNRLVVRILTNATGRLPSFLRKLEEAAAVDHEFELLYVGPPRTRKLDLLTFRDEETLLAARRAGFYDIPRPAGLDAVAKELGCSPSTVSYRLRHAIGKLLDGCYGPRR